MGNGSSGRVQAHMNELILNTNAYQFEMQHNNKVLFRSSDENSCIFSYSNIYRRVKKNRNVSFSNIMQP